MNAIPCVSCRYLLAALLALSGALLGADAFGAVGRIQFVSGDVKLVDAAGRERIARKGDPIEEGDTILAGALSSAQLRMSDNGIIAVRSDTQLKIDTYHFPGKEDGSERALMSLLKGGFRTITGIIGRAHKQNYLVNTPTSTIGIRGTDHEPFYIPPLAAGAPKPPAPPGTYDKVNIGIAFIRTPLGEVDIRQNQVGFAAPDKAPVLLPQVPDFFKATPPVRQVTEKEKEAEKQKAAAAAKAGEDKGTPAPEKTAEKPAATAAAEPSEVRSTAVVDNTSQLTPPAPTPVVSAPTTAPTITQPITGTTEGATLNLTTQTVTTGSGTTTLTGGVVALEGPVSFPNNANVRHNLRYLVSQTGSSDTFNVNARNAFSNLTNNPALSGPTTNTNYLFDLGGNLVRVLDTPYVVFDHAIDLAPTSTQFATPTPLAHAQLSLGEGAVASEAYFDPATQIRLGRWQGGVVNVTDLATGASYIDSLTAPTGGARSVLWEVHQAPASLPVSGQFHYTRVPDAAGNPSFATAPVDSYGNVGTLDGARLTADFTRMTVSAGVRVTMPSGPGGSLGIQNLSSRFSEAPIQNLGFNVSSNPADNPAGTDNLHISCFGTGCAPNQTYGGRIRGGFTSATGGATAEGAFFRYTFNTNYPDAATAALYGRVNDDYIDGLVAFRQGPAILPPSADINTASNPPGDASILYAYVFSSTPSPQTRTVSLDATAGGYTVDATGNLTRAAGMFFDEEQVDVTGGSGATNAIAPNGIVHGFVQTPSLSGVDFNGPFGPRAVLDSFHWVRGPAMYPWYASSAMVNPANIVGNVNYALMGAFVTDQNNSLGGVGSASLSVNFNQQSVNATVNASVPGGTFGAVASGVSMDDGGGFWASSGGPVHHTFSSLTFSGGGSVFGSMNGSLMGRGLNGAGLVFSFSSGTSPNRATGSVVFGNPTYNNGTTTVPFEASPLMDYRLALVASGMSPLGAITRDGSPTGPLVSEEANYAVQGGAISSVRTQFVGSETVSPVNPQGALIKFDGPWRFAFNPCSPSPCNSETQIAARFALADATGGGPTITNLPGTPPTAKSLEFGFDQDTGVRWGRWGGGFINVGDRASANQAGTVPTPSGTGSMNQIDLSVNNWHYLITTGQGGPVVLPVSGTASYQLVGATSPTSFTPGQAVPDVGTLMSATLTANFTAKTVDVAVNPTTPGSGNWAASANGVPIQKDTFFEARKSLSGMGPLSVTRNGSPAGTAGQIIGGFAGQTGRGAGIAYSLNQGGPTGTTVSGVAVFKRP